MEGGVSQKSEDNLAMTESEIEKQTSHINDLKRKIEELQVQADQAVKLKDQVDEYVRYKILILNVHYLQ
jgi:protein HOOK3